MMFESRRISVIVSNPCVADARVMKMAMEAQRLGFEVQVFATTGRGAASYEVVEGIVYKRLVWNPLAECMKLPIMRILTRLSPLFGKALALTLVPYLKYRLFERVFLKSLVESNPDIIHAHDLICLPVAVAVKRLRPDVGVVYDAHELEAHRNPPLPYFRKKFVTWLEKTGARHVSSVITVGDAIAELLQRELKKPVNVIYNSPVIKPCVTDIRKDLNLHESDRVLVYVGKITIGRGVEEILSLLPNLTPIMFAAVGPCDEKTENRLTERAKALGVSDRFRVLPPVPHEQVVSYIRGADLGIISVRPVTLSYELCMPNKLFELTFADVPIISNELPEIRKFLTVVGNGICVDFEEGAAALASKIGELLADQVRYRHNIEATATLETVLEPYAWSAQRETLKDVYASALPSS